MGHLRSVDELLWSWTSVIATARTDWERGFALSIARASKRRGWQPTPKQHLLMNRMVDALFASNTELIEDDE
ncbi:hypothetical protein [Paracoccus sp. KR1-242]|uniref:hypothetical protein n=1 Tax=Paracoccus sp. KR1-242 TaxID=3410028 RepID=UPI003C04F868